ncbi:hypothetical protein BKP45_19020 [Anaerobacillus alkalidiazotrophicus]|uniref:Sulfotransferase domain-containing protein n=1 Tax=Anaerobacillus alkalidiazotrophicus TaxID=472963 RepID=A0A1S2M3Q7_9BACI|nr:sulfotransferase domain-containing protein [Anaerobacillus alkalidiazotrophicus]OIJ18537.1 hypothetical protein BKP45_19020 [Anaerobacillus alkalidiazotrophicus]
MKSNTHHQLLQPFLMTSVPKSGTHLLHQLLNGMPHISMNITDSSKKFFFDDMDHFMLQNGYQDHYRRLVALKRNEFGLGHVFYTKQYENMLKKLKIKHIFLHRDPRDVLVSMSYFIPSERGWKEHPLRNEFKSLTPKDRILKLINQAYLGQNGKWKSYKSYIEGFYGWLNDKNTYSFSFEELINNRFITLMNLVNYLWGGLLTPVQKKAMVTKMIGNIDTNTSRTFRSGKVGAWKTEFDQEIKEEFKKSAGDLLIRYGYEKNNNW